jgi:hypothetical protein
VRIASVILAAFILFLGFATAPAEAKALKPYSQILCQQSLFFCHASKKGDSWEKLFPSWNERNIAKRVNRMNIPLRSGMILAIPKDMTGKTADDFSPFPKHLYWVTEKTVIFSLGMLYFAAYDKSGNRVITGPISAGRNCPAVKGECYTPTGWFRFYQKYGPNAVSSLYPILSYRIVERNGKKVRVPDRRGGAKTPWFMAIVGNIGAHGFEIVPGYNDSNGCIRQFFDDAAWLNQHFVEVRTVKRTAVNGKSRIIVVNPGTLAAVMEGLPDPYVAPRLPVLAQAPK